MINRWFKRLSERKGSAMVMVIVAIVVLSTLGLAILSLSVTNFRMSLVDKKTTLSFYLAESGLEQAYEIILNHVKAAVIEGNKVVNKKVEEFIQSERNRMTTVPGYDSPYIIGSDPAGPIDVDKIKDKLKTPTDPEYQLWLAAFKDKYKQYLSFEINLVNDLNNPSNYEAIDSVSSEKPDVKVVSVPSPLFNGDNPLVLKLTSLFEKEEYMKGKTVAEKVEMSFNIKVPDKIPDTIQTNSDAKMVEDNPIFNCAIVTPHGNIVFEGDDATLPVNDGTRVTINGNVYAYGEDGTRATLNAYGGFTLNRENNIVNVNGDIATFNVVQHKGVNIAGSPITISKNSNLTVNGNIYARHVLINEGEAGNRTQNNTITVNDNLATPEIEGKVHTIEDLIMYGDDSSITINGDWYATAAGAQKDTILSPDHPDPSLINIVGAEYDHTVSNDINKYTEMRMQQFSNYNNYLTLTAYPFKSKEKNTKIESPGEIFLIHQNSDERVYLMGKDATKVPPANALVIDASQPLKGIIITHKDMWVYGKVDFSGIIIDTVGCIHVRDSNPKVFRSDRNYLLNKSLELEEAGKNIFDYKRPTGDGLPWPDEKDVVISATSGEIGVGDSISMDPYKDLISISDWKKL